MVSSQNRRCHISTDGHLELPSTFLSGLYPAGFVFIFKWPGSAGEDTLAYPLTILQGPTQKLSASPRPTGKASVNLRGGDPRGWVDSMALAQAREGTGRSRQ